MYVCPGTAQLSLLAAGPAGTPAGAQGCFREALRVSQMPGNTSWPLGCSWQLPGHGRGCVNINFRKGIEGLSRGQQDPGLPLLGSQEPVLLLGQESNLGRVRGLRLASEKQ